MTTHRIPSWAGSVVLLAAISLGVTRATSTEAPGDIPAFVSPHIAIDQFGYPTKAQKIAVIRTPRIGFDAVDEFAPSKRYAVIDSRTGREVFAGVPVIWREGAVDTSSGDIVHWFHFTELDRPGAYFIMDLDRGARSPEFKIGDDVYRDVLKHAVRTFFYQRAAYPKMQEYAGEGWTDGASHIGENQDGNARLFSSPRNAATERDLRGGWYDAGDFNRYTNWASDYVITLLRAYREAPHAFSDDYGLPHSGNGIPDLLDEVKWGLEWLIRMQEPNGSVLSILGASHSSPPSTARGPSYYGAPSTSATLSAAGAFALGSSVFARLGDVDFAQQLLQRAKAGFVWAERNPDVLFRNNDVEAQTKGLGAGQQEVSDYGRMLKKLRAAVLLLEADSSFDHRAFIEATVANTKLVTSIYTSPFDLDEIDTLLDYARHQNSNPATRQRIRESATRALKHDNVIGKILGGKDPYRAYIRYYTWGSNKTKAAAGTLILLSNIHRLNAADPSAISSAAFGYLHYIHGVNPLTTVYLTNMYSSGATKSVNHLYHAWFGAESSGWSSARSSRFGPPPGYLVGGPNPNYRPDKCCPSNCGKRTSNLACSSTYLIPPMNQPPQKSYKDFNAGWPLNSWTINENSGGYQTEYIRLLSKFVR